MTNVFMMNERMTSRTNNHQILEMIVIPIFVFMMDAKDVFYRIITTNLASSYEISFHHRFSNSSIFWLKNRFCRFIDTRFGTIFSFFTRTILKWFFTMSTKKRGATSSNLRAMITNSRAILSFISSTRLMLKLLPASFTNRGDFESKIISHALFRTILSSINSISRNMKIIFTKQTNFRIICH